MGIRYADAVMWCRLAVLIVALAVALGFVFGDAWATLHAQWTAIYGPNAHGYLVLAMGVWITVGHWREQPPVEFLPARLALMAFGACAAMLVLMELMLIDSSRLVLAPICFLFAAAALAGWRVGQRLFWGAIFIYFALPQWWLINSLLQNMTVAAASSLLYWTGVPAHIEGNVVSIPSGTFEIADGCSGLNFFLAGSALASFVALTQLDGWRRRALLVGIAATCTVLFNWLRVYLVILIGHATDMQHYLVRVEHHTFGWALFLLLIGPVIFLGSRRGVSPNALVAEPSRARDPGFTAMPHVPWSSIRMILPLLVIAVVPRVVAWQSGRASALPDALPTILAGARRELVLPTSWSPRFIGADQEMVAYASDDWSITVYRAFYARQDRQHRLADSQNDVLGANFHSLDRATRAVQVGAMQFELTEDRGYLDGQEYLLWVWYEIAGRVASDKRHARLAEMLGRVRGRSDGAVFALMVNCHSECKHARDWLGGFLARAYAELRPIDGPG